MSGVRRVVPLTFGWEHLSKTVSVLGADPSIRLREPVPGVLCEVDGGWVLLDTGFNPAVLRDPPMRKRFHDPMPDYWAELPDPVQDPLVAAFDLVGLDPSIVSEVAVSHFHLDHSGGLRWFAGEVPVHAQQAELDYALGASHPDPESNAIFRVDVDDPRIDWRAADGDVEIAPGVTAVLTAGHTPGHQSFVVDLDESVGGGGYVFAFDAADLQENLDDELPVGHAIGVPAEETVEAIRRLKAIAAERGYRLLPGHDPDVWPAFTKELGYPTW
ncbi:MAG: N-acyl homoserine lactone hydrolase [Actinomycetota bacterium]|jgi:glyoxylase-like metal-dependent hydrolase (beta-lactamase superfamily II)|nr:N-acyl homoserine lactone hydrolase [Actinomycetota bacterium]